MWTGIDMSSIHTMYNSFHLGWGFCVFLTTPSCDVNAGALFCFPQVKLPKAAIAAAQEAGKAPDLFYCLKLLETTGVLTVPGSEGYGQKEG
jgi:aspartate/methionine/tyrosine aminotransferase